jgi:hypothetical protein
MRVNRPSESAIPPPPASSVATSPGPELGAHGQREAGGAGFARVLRSLAGELDRGEALAERAIHGGSGSSSMSPDKLIALQAGIYRYSEAVDLVTKLVDRGTQAVKTTLQNQ